ncbi:hypothetical protein BJ741DRAFT_618116 [Chytriomyces cf. hyalinus JEL632]|nr:hypothetical protein BJ741DRAFT_618116 [Chytriomyces cf. hyalinus JEL632]
MRLFDKWRLSVAVSWNSLKSLRSAKDYVKGVLAYFLCLSFVFSSLASPWLQSRVLANVLLVPVVLSPAQTVGQFGDLAILFLISVGISSGLWAVVILAAGYSHLAMGAVFFIVTYLFSIPRAMNPARYFAFSLNGPVFVFTAIQTTQSAFGPNSSDGNLFDYRFMISNLYSYLVGVGICLAVNVLVWPNFAERNLQTQFEEALTEISALTASIVLALDDRNTAPESREAAKFERQSRVLTLNQLVTAIRATLDGAAAEISYSKYSLMDYKNMFVLLGRLAGILSSVVNVIEIQREGGDLVAECPSVHHGLKPVLDTLAQKGAGLVDASKAILRQRTKVDPATSQLLSDELRAALEAFQANLPDLIHSILPVAPNAASAQQLRDAWEQNFHMNALNLGVLELIQDILHFHSTLLQTESRYKFQLDYRHFLPSFLARRSWSPTADARIVSTQLLNEAASATTASVERRWLQTFRKIIVGLKSFILSRPSIYGFKCALAVLILHTLIFTQLEAFNTYHIGATLVTFLIALTPSLGQTFVALPVQIASTSVGAFVGFLAVTAFGPTGVYGIVGFGVLLCVPCMYLMLFSQKHLVLGLLTLLAYNFFVTYLYAVRGVPGIDTPAEYLYKVILTTSIALLISLALTVIIFPTLSRTILRNELSCILRNLGSYYTDILVAAFTADNEAPSPSPGSAISDTALQRLENTRQAIATLLDGIPPLLSTARVEPRVEAPFQYELYDRVFHRLQRIFACLECARYSVGRNVMDRNVRAIFACDEVRPWRGEMNRTLRLLFYLDSTSLLAKSPLPADMPNALFARHKFFDGFIHVAMRLLQSTDVDPSAEIHQSVFLTEGWMRACGLTVSAAQVSSEMDKLSKDFRELFGEIPDLMVLNPDLAWPTDSHLTEHGQSQK